MQKKILIKMKIKVLTLSQNEAHFNRFWHLLSTLNFLNKSNEILLFIFHNRYKYDWKNGRLQSQIADLLIVVLWKFILRKWLKRIYSRLSLCNEQRITIMNDFFFRINRLCQFHFNSSYKKTNDMLSDWCSAHIYMNSIYNDTFKLFRIYFRCL